MFAAVIMRFRCSRADHSNSFSPGLVSISFRFPNEAESLISAEKTSRHGQDLLLNHTRTKRMPPNHYSARSKIRLTATVQVVSLGYRITLPLASRLRPKQRPGSSKKGTALPVFVPTVGLRRHLSGGTDLEDQRCLSQPLSLEPCTAFVSQDCSISLLYCFNVSTHSLISLFAVPL